MPGAVADLTNTLGWTVMNYYAPYWVRYDSLQLSNPPKKEKREQFSRKVSDLQQSSWSEFWVLWVHTSPKPFATPLVWFLEISRPNLFENKVPFFYPGPLWPTIVIYFPFPALALYRARYRGQTQKRKSKIPTPAVRYPRHR